VNVARRNWRGRSPGAWRREASHWARMRDRSRYRPMDLSPVKRGSIEAHPRKVSHHDLARVITPTPTLLTFLDGLPNILIGRDFRDFLSDLTQRRAAGQPLLLMYGGHLLKCGLSPLLIDLMERGYVSALATNGSGAVHDVELSLFGQTSEDVAQGLADGSFGMVRETADFFNQALLEGRGEGYGEALGRRLVDAAAPYLKNSILGAAYRLSIPLTVHVAIGTDIVHQHPGVPAAELGEATYRDFRIVCTVLSTMVDGGIVINLGSAVVLPEVFLKALTVARNLSGAARNLLTANFDMLQHYRPRVNVVDRPTRTGGRGFNFTGHHEIMIPLLHAGIRCYSELGSGKESETEEKT